jgi:hypothetical protein
VSENGSALPAEDGTGALSITAPVSSTATTASSAAAAAANLAAALGALIVRT